MSSNAQSRRQLMPQGALMVLGLTMLLASAVFLACAMPGHAYATVVSNGAHVYALKTGVTYSSYDVTGDGESDTIKVALSGIEGDRYSRIKVLVNGKTALNQKAGGYSDYVEAQLIKLKNGKTFLYFFGPFENDDSDVCAVFRYSGGKFKMNIDCNKGFGRKIGSHFGGKIKKVSGNAMIVTFGVMSYMAGNIQADYTYRYKGGKLKKASSIGKIRIGWWVSEEGKRSKAYVVKKNITAYKSASCKAKKFTIKKGQKAKFLRVYVKGNTVRFLMKAGGRTGWIKVANRYDSSLMYKRSDGGYEPPFKGLSLAG